MPSPIFSLNTIHRENEELHNLAGWGTRRERKHQVKVWVDEDGSILPVPTDDKYTNDPPHDIPTEDTGRLSINNSNHISKSPSAASMQSIQPDCEYWRGMTRLSSNIEDTKYDDPPEPDMESGDGDGPLIDDFAVDSGSVFTPEDEMGNFEDLSPVNMSSRNVATAPVSTKKSTENHQSKALDSDHMKENDVSTLTVRNKIYKDETTSNDDPGKIVDFVITAPPPSWVKDARESDTGGGHGISISPDGTMIVKKTHLDEIAFYERMEGNDSTLKHIKKLTPKYYGCFTDKPPSTITAKDSKETELSVAKPTRPGLKRHNTSDGHDNSIMLENLTYGFRPDSVTQFDFKMGRIRHNKYAPDNTPEKEAKMNKQTVDCTSKEHALSLVWADTAIWDILTSTYSHVRTEKGYGKTLKRTEDDYERENHEMLPEAMVRLFPSPRDNIVFKDHASRDNTTSDVPIFASDLERYRYEDRMHSRSSTKEIKPNMFDTASNKTTIDDFNSENDSFEPTLVDLRRMQAEKEEIEDKIELIDDVTEKLASEFMEAVKKSNWQLNGASVYIAYGEKKDKHDYTKKTINHEQTRIFNDQLRRNKTESDSSGTDEEEKPFISTYTSPCHVKKYDNIVKLIDPARSHYAAGPDRDWLDGLSNTVTLLSGRRETLESYKSDMESQITDIRSQIMGSSTGTN